METGMDEGLKKRIIELANTAYQRGISTHTSFLSLDEQEAFYGAKKELAGVRYVLTGGCPMAERKLLYFFASYEDGESADIPIRWIKISPVNEKFTEELTHRDFLGSVMGLGIERDRTGDIIVEGHAAYMACLDELAEYICDHLDSVRRTRVQCEMLYSLPSELAEPKIEESVGSVASERLDALITLAFRLSRGLSSDTVKAGYVYVDGRQVLSPGTIVRDGSIVSVRHRGRFIYMGKENESKKGRLIVRVGVYR